ncbi:hypothetical protein DPMN_147186 [Dreissena polymorpha]|uniref:Uncharacterized protein n=1 Tax=Dreissena polymorpha TaxID=45954 RepID=A0A9D4J2R5_DREPO|nr:hypothetical protein DPMN_147186 [Dreissena polymorpha]
MQNIPENDFSTTDSGESEEQLNDDGLFRMPTLRVGTLPETGSTTCRCSGTH